MSEQPVSSPSTEKLERAVAPPAIRFESWPLRESPLRCGLVGAGLLAVGVVVLVVTGQLHLAVLAMVVLAAVLWRFFLPVQFELNEAGVDQRFFRWQRHIPWQAIDHYRGCSDGVLLSPDADPSPLASMRGLFLPFGSHRDEILALLGHYLERNAE